MRKNMKYLLVSVLASALVANISACKPRKTTVSTSIESQPNSVNSQSDNSTNSVVAKYSITYVINGHGNAVDAVAEATNLPESLPTLEAEGFAFLGWYLDEGLQTPAVAGAKLEGNTTLYAKWEATTHSISFNLGEEDGTIENIEVGSKYVKLPIPSVEGKLFLGWYAEAELSTLVKEGDEYSTDVLYAKFTTNTIVDRDVKEDAIKIGTVEEFLAFRKMASVSTDAVLTADIDLAGVTLPASTISFSGVFDGQGHKIKNAKYENAAKKTGILFAKTVGAVIKNVSFIGCSASGTVESIGVVAGKMDSGAVVKNVELKNCSIDSTGNYAGLLFGRNESSGGYDVEIDGLTIKNNCSVSCGNYGGLIVGDSTSNITLRNSQVTGTLSKTSGNFGLLLGRTRNDTQYYRIENVVADIKYDGTGTSGGYIVSDEKCNIHVKNSVFYNCSTPTTAKSSVTYADNVNFVGVDNAPSYANKVANTDVNADWYKTVLSDFDKNWVVESDGGIKLKNASANVVGANDKMVSLEVLTGGAKTRFHQGEEYSSTGIVVSATYDSDVTVNLNEDAYEVISSAYDKDNGGTYTIEVKDKNSDIKGSYEVKVVVQTGFEINDESVKHIYSVGESFSPANLIVYSVWSDGIKEKMSSSEYNVVSTSFDNTQAGTYNISVTNKEFTPIDFVVEVVNFSKPEVVDNKVVLGVDANATGEGVLVDGIPTFTSVNKALEYYKTANYDAGVKKIINVKDGTYREKVDISLPNVILNGETREGTKIVYNLVESSIDPVTGQKYMLTCATVNVNATGFEAHNISIINDFDYKNNQYNPAYSSVKESDPQGIALTLNGDKFIIENCHLFGNQDTLYLKAGRAYFKGGIIEGNIDFIFGEAKGIGYFDEVNINAVAKALEAKDMKNNGYVTAFKGDSKSEVDYGVIFNKCSFTADENVPNGSMSLGRPWGPLASVAYINCDFSAAYSKLAYDGSSKSRWEAMSGNTPVGAKFVEYGSTGAGAITEAVNGGKILTAEQAALYTMANAFAINNGSVTWTSAFDPTSDVSNDVDNNTYYYFNGNKSSSGTSYTYDKKINGESITWNGMTVDGTKGKVEARESNKDTQINKGGQLTFTVKGGSTVLVETYPGYHAYSLNGVATFRDTFAVYYPENTTVTFTALDTVYLYSIVVMPNTVAPTPAGFKSLEVTGYPTTENACGQDVDLSKVVVKLNKTDGAIYTLTEGDDYSIDTSKVNKEEPGTYDVDVIYGEHKFTFSVTYVGEVNPAITETTTFSFKDDNDSASANYFVYDNSKGSEITLGKMTIKANSGVISDNGDWFQFYNGATATILVEGNFKLTYSFYQSKATLEVRNNGELVAKNKDGSYSLETGSVEIKDVSTGVEYVGNFVFTKVEAPIEEEESAVSLPLTISFKDDIDNKSDSYFVYEGTGSETLLNLGGVKFSGGTMGNNNDWFKFYNGAQAEFDIEQDAVLALSFYSNQKTVTVTVDDVTIAANEDGTYTLPAGHVVITDTSSGTEYLGKIELTKAPSVISKSVTYSFRDDVENKADNYIVYENQAINPTLDLGQITLNKNSGQCNDNNDWLNFCVGASIEFNVASECELSMVFYSSRTLVVKVNDNVIEENEDGTYTLPAGHVVIIGNNNSSQEYLGKLTLTFPKPSISSTVTYSFRDDVENKADNYIVYENQAINPSLELGLITLNKNGGQCNDNGNWLNICVGASIEFDVAGASTLSMVWYENTKTITVTVDGVEVSANEDGTYTLSKGHVVITDTRTDSQEYLGSLTITF